MTKKGKLRKGISILLAVCMALPVGFVTKSETVHGKVIDADTTKRELWSTSFESADGFKTSTVDDKKGTANITTNELSYQINGNLSGEIESYSGSAAKNDNEVLKNCHKGAPVYLTKNGRGRFVVMDIEDYERDRAEKKLLMKLQEAEEAVKDEEGWLNLEELKALMGE